MNDLQGDSNANCKKTKDGKLPAFQFYPGDWKRHPGIQSLDAAEKWYWLELVMLMHESKERGVLLLNGAPMPEEAIARILGLDNQKITTLITKLITYGIAERRQEDNSLCCDWMIKEESIRQIRQAAGKKGGNPEFKEGQPNPYYHKDKQKDNQGDKQKITPSSSSSSSSSDLIHTYGNSEEPQLEVPLVPLEAPPVQTSAPTKPAGKARKPKDKIANLIDMTEAELLAIGKHPSLQAPRHLTRKQQELEPQDDEAASARVWLTQSEVERLREKWGDEKLFALIERASQYFGIQPARAKDYADHNLLLQNWERRA